MKSAALDFHGKQSSLSSRLLREPFKIILRGFEALE